MPHCYGGMREVTILVLSSILKVSGTTIPDHIESVQKQTNKNKNKNKTNKTKQNKTKTKNETCFYQAFKLCTIYLFPCFFLFSVFFLSLLCIKLLIDEFLFTKFNYQFLYLSIISFVHELIYSLHLFIC